MSEEVRKRCMEPFFTTKGERGTGLGLAQVLAFAHRAGGEIEIQSEAGRGTAVMLILPAGGVPNTVRSLAAAAEHPSGLRILFVDDEDMLREVVSMMLTSEGHRCETATNGREALGKIERQTFDVVLTDRCMPEMNGNQLAERIKLIRPEMPVIMLSGVGEFMAECPVGVDLLLNKPIGLQKGCGKPCETFRPGCSGNAERSGIGSRRMCVRRYSEPGVYKLDGQPQPICCVPLVAAVCGHHVVVRVRALNLKCVCFGRS